MQCDRQFEKQVLVIHLIDIFVFIPSFSSFSVWRVVGHCHKLMSLFLRMCNEVFSLIVTERIMLYICVLHQSSFLETAHSFFFFFFKKATKEVFSYCYLLLTSDFLLIRDDRNLFTNIIYVCMSAFTLLKFSVRNSKALQGFTGRLLKLFRFSKFLPWSLTLKWKNNCMLSVFLW